MATLLIKEFIELGRALGSATDADRDRFNEFLSESGYASLNDYKASSDDSDEVKQKNFDGWLVQLNDKMEFAFTMLESSRVPKDGPFKKKEDKPTHKDEDTAADLRYKPVDVPAVAVPGIGGESRQMADQISSALTEALGNLKVGGGAAAELKERYDKAIEVLSIAKGATESKLDKCWAALRSHETNDVLHAGGTPPSFSLHIVEANREFEGDAPLHYKFPLVSAAVLNNIPTMIVGPAGWGKTSMVKQLAKLCSDTWDDFSGYRIQSIGPQTSKSDILGYMDANGKYVESVFYQCFSRGMLYACDEADAGSAGSLTLLNQGFANEECNFPGQDEMTERHPRFTPMFLANTYGQGANATYVGRNQLDAATLDRFAVIEYDYDEAWEGDIAGVKREGNKLKLEAGGSRTPEEWMDYVCRVRKAVDTLAVRHVVSPRATINGIKLLKAGVGFTHVSNMCVWKGLDSATRTKVMNEADGE